MLHKFWLLLFISISIISCQNTEKQYLINGEVPLSVEGKVYLFQYKNREFTLKDSAEIVQGKFQFKGITESLAYALRLNDLKKRVDFFLENTSVHIQLNSQWDIENITGSQNTVLFRQWQLLDKEQLLRIEDCIQTHPASPVTAYYLARKAYLYEYQPLKSLRKKLSSSLNTNAYIAELDIAIEQLENIQPGKPAPDIMAQTPEGNTIKLSDLQGKVVLVDFWASWCPDCRKESPNLVQLYEQYNKYDFTILGISIDQNKENWKKAIEKDALFWHQGIVEGEWNSQAVKTYVIRWIPTSFLIDKNGIIISRNIDNSNLFEQLDKLFSENITTQR